MLTVRLEGFKEVQRKIDAMGKQARFAASRALNTAAFAAMREGQRRIESAFVGPTRWTIKSWYVRKKATKSDLVASVGWSDYLVNKQFKGPDYYLSQHFNSGTRQHTRFEERLISKSVMPAGMNAVPGKAAEEMGMIDGRGNMKPGVIVAILSALQAFNQAGSNMNANGRKRQSANKRAARQVYWAGKPGPNTPNGIWALDEKFRGGRGRLRPVVIFVRRARYRKRLDLDQIANAVVQRTFVAEFDKELEAAMRTAR
jgi:hypothetical protein